MILRDLFENAEGLNVGDEVIITGNVQFNGATGVIDSFGRDQRFVVVNLYNHGLHSFHSSDVSANEYADSDAEEADVYDRDAGFRDYVSRQDVDEASDISGILAASQLNREFRITANVDGADKKFRVKAQSPRVAQEKLVNKFPTARISNVEEITDLNELRENLRKWFKEKWVRFGPDGKIRGDCARGSSKEGKPKCLPQSKAQALGKKGRASAAAKKRREDPNPERRGPARNVATKVKEDNNPKFAALIKNIQARLKKDDYQRPEIIKRVAQMVQQADPTIQDAMATAQQLVQQYGQGPVVKQTNVNDLKAQARSGNLTAQLPKTSAGTPSYAQQHATFEQELDEKQDACYNKVKSRYKVWPSAYASGALVQCRKKGASNWGNKGKK